MGVLSASSLGYIHIKKGTFNLIGISNKQTQNDLFTTESFLDDKRDFNDRYNILFKHFTGSFLKYSTNDFALVNYPGMLSTRGNIINQVEGTARTLPLFGAWIYSGRNPIVNIEGKDINLIEVIKESVLSGTDPKSVNYWGDIEDYDQKILEASDIVKTLWLTKSQVWDKFTENQKEQVSVWLERGGNAKTAKNNWLLSPFIIQLFLNDVGYLHKTDDSNYTEFKKSYLGYGWFKDGIHGPVDYYNAWGITYDLFWISLLSDYDKDFINKSLRESSYLTSHLVSKNGIPFMGRSVCYRTAVPTPVLIEGYISNDPIKQGIAKSSLDYTWKYFIRHQALVSDTLSMGYYNNDKRFVDSYSGSGSCLWGLRSLVVAFMNNKDSNLWSGDFEKLPIDKHSFNINAEKIGWIINGDKSSGEIRVIIPSNYGNDPKVKDTNIVKEIIWRIIGKAGRTSQHDIEYLKPYYSSSEPISDIEN